MSEWRLEAYGVVVISNCLVYCLLYGGGHRWVVFAIGELPYDKSTYLTEDSAHTQIANHTINMVMPLAYIFNQ